MTNLGKIGQPSTRSTSVRSIQQSKPKAHRAYSMVRLGERPRVKRATVTIDPSVIRPRPSVAIMLDTIKGERL